MRRGSARNYLFLNQMNRIDQINTFFNENVPRGKESFMVLQTHLLMERELLFYVKSRIEDDSLLKEIEDSHSPVGSGLGLILLAQTLSKKDDFPPVSSSMNEDVWGAIKLLNRLRNKLVHILDPDDDGIRKFMKKFVEFVDQRPLESEDNINRRFYSSAKRLITFIAIDRYPIGEKFHKEILEDDLDGD